jgi:hypothetical protein
MQSFQDGEQYKAYCPSAPNETILYTGTAVASRSDPAPALLLTRVVKADTCDQPCLLQSADRAPLKKFRQAGRDASVTLYGSLQMQRPAFDREIQMETVKTDPAITNDVLHLGSQSKLSPEEIAKALAHHNRHHGGNAPQEAAANTGAGKKNKKSK